MGNLLSIDNIRITSNGALSVAGVKTEKTSAIYPNPVTDSFEISNASDIVSAAVFDASGRMVKEYGKEQRYDISSLASGTYQVIIKRNSGTETQTIIKK
ncbi:MAG: T9SS type A sorting domain-containing protein [Bergeyella sp.]